MSAERKKDFVLGNHPNVELACKSSFLRFGLQLALNFAPLYSVQLVSTKACHEKPGI